jgi:TRAP-type C4-dicarboxylate transport system substrate-binding protein
MQARLGAAAVALLAASAVAAGAADAAELSKQHFKVVGTWNFTTHYKELEKPFFEKELTEKSGGKLTFDHKSITELNLKGFEVVDLTRKGVYDIATGVVAYVADRSPEIEGVDLTGVAPEIDQAIQSTKVYRKVIEREFREKYGVHLLAMGGYPSQQFWCSKPVESLADLAGKKIRVYGASLGDFVQGLGGVPVTIAFGEVVPALQKGVADCGITGTLPAYDAKWREVVTHLYIAGLGWAPSFIAMNQRRWDSLDQPTRDFLTKEFAAFEERDWEGTRENDRQGIDCNTGLGPCRFGEPGKIKLVKQSPEDQKKQKEVVEKFVLSAWAKRCGEACVKEWNATIGKVVGLTAKAQ